jgi:hypothetical protein
MTEASEEQIAALRREIWRLSSEDPGWRRNAKVWTLCKIAQRMLLIGACLCLVLGLYYVAAPLVAAGLVGLLGTLLLWQISSWLVRRVSAGQRQWLRQKLLPLSAAQREDVLLPLVIGSDSDRRFHIAHFLQQLGVKDTAVTPGTPTGRGDEATP